MTPINSFFQRTATTSSHKYVNETQAQNNKLGRLTKYCGLLATKTKQSQSDLTFEKEYFLLLFTIASSIHHSGIIFFGNGIAEVNTRHSCRGRKTA